MNNHTATSSSGRIPEEEPPEHHTEPDDSSSQTSAVQRGTELPNMPTLVTTSPDNYGALNAEDEANLDVIDGLPGRSLRRPGHRLTRPSVGFAQQSQMELEIMQSTLTYLSAMVIQDLDTAIS